MAAVHRGAGQGGSLEEATGGRPGARRDGRTSAVVMAVAALAVVALGLAAWWGVWNGDWVFDDQFAIVGNGPLRRGDWLGGAFDPTHTPLANRPLSCLTLVGDFAIWGPGPFGPHLGNLLLHLATAVLLLCTVRLALLAPNLAGCFDARRATSLATAVVAVWVVHPVGGDTVAYATQRSTSLISLFLVVALYATLRAFTAAKPWRWRAVALAALACGMASKEDMVTAPVLVLLFERAFLLPSWGVMRTRLSWYGALASTWIVLAVCLWLGPVNATVGYDAIPPVTAWEWLMTQAGVILHYLANIVWPADLRTAYDWGIVRDFGRALWPGLVVVSLLALTVRSWWRPRSTVRRELAANDAAQAVAAGDSMAWGWLGALIFLMLTPTSSILPIVTELAAERRVYLPMLAVIVPAVIGGDALLRRAAPRAGWIGTALLAAVVVALAVVAHTRVAAYSNEAAVWTDAYEKRDPQSRTTMTARILTNYGLIRKYAGERDAAFALFDQAMECEDQGEATVVQYASSLLARDRYDEAVRVTKFLVLKSGTAKAHAMAGIALARAHSAARAAPDDPRLREALVHLSNAIEGGVAGPEEWSQLAYVWSAQGRLEEAQQAYRRACNASPKDPEPYLRLAETLVRLDRTLEVRQVVDAMLGQRPDDVPARLRFAAILVGGGDREGADALLRQALSMEPDNAEAAAMLRQLRAGTLR
jgi:tetratricopeptide (TPR) repeat protein